MKTLPCVQLPCPRCGEPSANVSVQLWTLDDPEGENFHCGECEGTFSRADLDALIRRWPPVLKWLDAVPTPPAD